MQTQRLEPETDVMVTVEGKYFVTYFAFFFLCSVW